MTNAQGGAGGFDRVNIAASADPPAITRRRWIEAPQLVDVAGASFALTPDGRVIYKRGAKIEPVHHLRVIPNWVAQMKRAVDEAKKCPPG